MGDIIVVGPITTSRAVHQIFGEDIFQISGPLNRDRFVHPPKELVGLEPDIEAIVAGLIAAMTTRLETEGHVVIGRRLIQDDRHRHAIIAHPIGVEKKK